MHAIISKSSEKIPWYNKHCCYLEIKLLSKDWHSNSNWRPSFTPIYDCHLLILAIGYILQYLKTKNCTLKHCLTYIIYRSPQLMFNNGGSVVGWATMLQAGRSQVQVPMRLLNFFNWPNPSSRTMVLGSIQPLTEMSTRNIPGG
jgi:hypothetical protein